MRTVAYLDANSGSMIAATIAAGGAGVAVAARMGMQRLRKPFSRKSAAETEATEAEPVEEDA